MLSVKFMSLFLENSWKTYIKQWFPGFTISLKIVLQLPHKPTVFVVAQLLIMSNFLQPHGLQHARLFCPSIISWSLLRFTAIEPVILSNHLILCCPLLLLPSVFSSIKVFSNESAVCSRWPNYWSFGFSSSPSNEYSGLISFRIH